MSAPGFFYSAEDQARNQALARQQAYAQALMGQDPGKAKFGGLRAAGNSILGAFLAKRADEQALSNAKGAEDRYVKSMAQLLKGNGVPTQSPQISTAAGTAPQVNQEAPPGMEGPTSAQNAPPAPAQPQQPQQAPGGDFMARLIATGNPQLIQQFAPGLVQNQMAREEKVWENSQPMAVARQQEIAAQGNQTQQNALFNNNLNPTAYQKEVLRREGSQDAETRRHNLASEANAAQAAEFGKGMQGRAYSILAGGLRDPSLRGTPEYATAWQILSNPRVDPNTGTIVAPDLSAFAPPTSQTGQGQPQQQRMPSLQAFAPPNPSQADALSAGFATRLKASNDILNQNAGALSDVGQVAKSHIPLVGNFAVSPKFQKASQAKRDFINAQLRRESGAAIAESEFENADKQYFEQPGDSAAVKAQKADARARAIRNMELSAGNTLLPPGVFQQASPPRGAPMVPQQQGFGQSAAPAPSGGIPGVIRYDINGNRVK